jgi:hypothetical protein
MQELEHIPKGAVLQVDDVSIVCKSDSSRSYTVYAVIVTFFMIPVGVIQENEVSWFSSTIDRPPTQIMYLGNGQFSIKRLIDPLEEFNKLSKVQQNKALMELLSQLEDYRYRKPKL